VKKSEPDFVMHAPLRAIVALAALIAIVGLVGLADALADSEAIDWQRNVLRVLSIVLFFGSAVWLIIASSRDVRASYLGGVFMLTASSFGSAGLVYLFDSPPPYSQIITWLSYLNPDAFIPLFCWMFFRDFPQTRSLSQSHRSVVELGTWISVIAGVLLFATKALTPVGGLLWKEAMLDQFYSPIFWGVLAILTLPALAFALWRIAAADVRERRRTRLFMLGLVLGSGPVLAAFLLSILSTDFAKFMSVSDGQWWPGLALRSLPLFIPVVTAYAVLVQDALDLRLVVRKAIRYALARYSVLAITLVPFVLSALFLIRHRDESISEILVSGKLPVFFIFGGLGVALLISRHRVLRAIDKRFFREQYDAYRILHDVVEQSRVVSSRIDLAELLLQQTDSALHLERSAILFTDSERRNLVSLDERVRRLPLSSLLAEVVRGSSACLEVDLQNPDSALQRLPERDREWLSDGAFRLLTPMLSSSGELLGLLALGEKRSELGFSSDDRALLAGAAASAAEVLERLLAERSPSSGRGFSERGFERSEVFAGECIVCGKVFSSADSMCGDCETNLRPAMIPRCPFGKYQLERRLGAGGMGVVYLAHDLALGRNVAIKTLPRLSPERAIRLRREARAMASITHPNVALIYAVEFFRGVPILVLEYLPLGTVRQRLRSSHFEIGGVVRLGLALSGALEEAHSAGILHRDIKPSNVGYSAPGVPKLLDFGLARIIADLQHGADESTDVTETTLSDPVDAATESQFTVGVAGTPGYLAPEAMAGASPGPSFDLWSLAVLLIEALTGANPFQGPTPAVTRRRVMGIDRVDIQDFLLGQPSAAVEFFEKCLHRERRQRPSSAPEFRRRLEILDAAVESFAPANALN
jgi:hypothetical protein